MNNTSQYNYRIRKDKLLLWIVCFFAGVTAIPLLAILGKVLLKGWRQINLDFFIKTVPDTLEALLANSAGEIIPGGIANGIVSTFIMVLCAAVVAIPIGIMCGVFLSENKNHNFARIVSFLTDLLQGTPSIIFGIIIYMWIVVSLKSYSGLAGSAALALMMLPLIVRSTEETLKMLPNTLKEAGLALGGSYTLTIMRVLLPSAAGPILTGILLSISRVIGETAPLMLTALGSTAIQWDISKPASSVSLLIWEFYNDPNLQNMIWSASLFLLAFVFILNIIAKKIRKKWKIN